VLQHRFDVATDLGEDRRVALREHLHVRTFERVSRAMARLDHSRRLPFDLEPQGM
jgi:hypothetical protein